MSKDKLHIIDTMFSHAHSSSWYNHPTDFEWVREDVGDKVVFTDTSLQQVSNIQNKKKGKCKDSKYPHQIMFR